MATHSGRVMSTHSNRPFGCRHTRSLSFGADCWCWCFARAAKLMVKLKDRPLTSECRRPGRHRRARAGAAAHTRRVGYVGPVDKAMLTQTCTRQVHSSSEESVAWASAPWSRLIVCSCCCSYGAVASSSRPRRHIHTCICLPLTRDCSTAASLHHRAFDLRNPAPPPFSPAEPPKTLPKSVS